MRSVPDQKPVVYTVYTKMKENCPANLCHRAQHWYLNNTGTLDIDGLNMRSSGDLAGGQPAHTTETGLRTSQKLTESSTFITGNNNQV